MIKENLVAQIGRQLGIQLSENDIDLIESAIQFHNNKKYGFALDTIKRISDYSLFVKSSSFREIVSNIEYFINNE